MTPETRDGAEREAPLTFQQGLLVLASCAVLLAEAVQLSGIGGSYARSHPAGVSLETMALVLVPLGYIASVGVVRAGQWVAQAAKRNPMLVAAVPLAAVGVGVVAVQRTYTPPSPARDRAEVPSFNIEGDSSRLEAHVTLPPGMVVAGGTTQRKVFKFRNVGNVPWLSRWLCRADPELNTADNLLTEDCVEIRDTAPGGTVDVAIDIKVPRRAGRIGATWKISDGRGSWFYGGATPVHVDVEVTLQGG